MTGIENLDPATLLHLARLGAAFASQHRGRRPGFLHRTLQDVVAGRRLTFDALLAELEIAAARRELYGAQVSPVEKVDRIWRLLTYHDPKRGRVQATFGTVRNHLTTIRKGV